MEERIKQVAAEINAIIEKNKDLGFMLVVGNNKQTSFTLHAANTVATSLMNICYEDEKIFDMLSDVLNEVVRVQLKEAGVTMMKNVDKSNLN